MGDVTNPNPIHASCVALNGRAVLILGASGAGKSAMALRLMAYGAGLVADDRVHLSVADQVVWADAPDTIRGRIEARGIGILAAEPVGPAQVAVAVDLDQKTDQRLPQRQEYFVHDVPVPLLHNPESGHFVESVLQYLKAEQGDLDD
ncbi:HPr kinase/phosphorylase [Thalassobium sp. R2A62]|jgi:HPr kinase/phosphorylase|uniref:HPr kinase/phosphorylase n=1 Tax=Thalassobium sp. R2A62 TaxID=633131 RepID=UPI0001B1D239|nr:HPr kinase/phosphatase C-terminal domain-containing protein [Thalassobium sp. R2A62]EET46896.1 Hpr serine kinase/phosphatase domain protein [Thalassobium sp. R2A62]MDG1340256.1 HPr kinase/phosphatase C-terminal domain-containing protein [Paracoccaceae bacterium]MDG2453826.1 HPr kinase/phosphatase C-terminal domain-containing protein [Paracoccaceae bacterium]